MIKESFKRQGNEYITKSVVTSFCKNNNITFNETLSREDGIKLIEEFAKRDNNKVLVDEWIDKTIKAGRKHIYMTKINFNKFKEIYKLESFWNNIIKEKKLSTEYIGINDLKCDNNLKCRRIEVFKSEKKVTKVCLYLSQFVIDTNKLCKEEYPIFADVYIEEQILVLRIKSKANLYNIKENYDSTKKLEDYIDYQHKISSDSIAKEVLTHIGLLLDCNVVRDINIFKENIKNIYYNIFKELTTTPQVIQKDLDKSKPRIDTIALELLNLLGVDTKVYGKDAQNDLMMLAEKYKSISYPDKTIFTNGKFGYPVKLIATDSEDTRLEGTASNLEPFQTKAAFFDYKKNIITQECCDTISLAVHRKITKYFSKKPFIILMETKGKFAKFRIDEYINEEDVEHVLSRIITNS